MDTQVNTPQRRDQQAAKYWHEPVSNCVITAYGNGVFFNLLRYLIYEHSYPTNMAEMISALEIALPNALVAYNNLFLTNNLPIPTSKSTFGLVGFLDGISTGLQFVQNNTHGWDKDVLTQKQHHFLPSPPSVKSSRSDPEIRAIKGIQQIKIDLENDERKEPHVGGMITAIRLYSNGKFVQTRHQF
jgi:hypothetical protein